MVHGTLIAAAQFMDAVAGRVQGVWFNLDDPNHMEVRWGDVVGDSRAVTYHDLMFKPEEAVNATVSAAERSRYRGTR